MKKLPRGFRPRTNHLKFEVGDVAYCPYEATNMIIFEKKYKDGYWYFKMVAKGGKIVDVPESYLDNMVKIISMR